MLFTTVLFGAAIAVTVLADVGNSTNGTTNANPSRYVRAPIYRQGPVNDPQSGYYWIDLEFGTYTASCIVDSGMHRCRTGEDVDVVREWGFMGRGPPGRVPG